MKIHQIRNCYASLLSRFPHNSVGYPDGRPWHGELLSPASLHQHLEQSRAPPPPATARPVLSAVCLLVVGDVLTGTIRYQAAQAPPLAVPPPDVDGEITQEFLERILIDK